MYEGITKKPLKIRVIRWLMKIAWWLTRPSLKGVKFGKHFDIIVEMDTTEISRISGCHRANCARIYINSFNVFEYKTKETAEIDAMIAQAENETGDGK